MSWEPQTAPSGEAAAPIDPETVPGWSREGRLRLDKWLWAARFFKTRALAHAAVEGGKVKLNDARPKPSREVLAGDRLEITLETEHWTVVVAGLNEHRRPAPEARLLYRESAESAARRAADALARKGAPQAEHGGRPTKKARRQWERWQEG